MEHTAIARVTHSRTAASHLNGEPPAKPCVSPDTNGGEPISHSTRVRAFSLPYPNGWFALCPSSQLKRGQLLSVPFMGNELLVYRTQSGQVRVTEPYCPHLGAHLGYGGQSAGREHGVSLSRSFVRSRRQLRWRALWPKAAASEVKPLVCMRA